jgi:hypothetical protein
MIMHDGTPPDQGAYAWHKSSYSGGQNGDCVETGTTLGGQTSVRDTKQNKNGPVLTFGSKAWTSFVDSVKAGEFLV